MLSLTTAVTMSFGTSSLLQGPLEGVAAFTDPRGRDRARLHPRDHHMIGVESVPGAGEERL